MATYTAQQIIDRAAALADMKDGFISAFTWLDWLNDERQALNLFMAQSGWPPNPALTTSTLTPASTGILLNANASAIIGVWEVTSSGRYRRLTARDVISSNFQSQASGPITGPAIYFYAYPVVGADTVQINLFPKPTSGTYGVAYIPEPTALTAVTGSITYPLRFERRIILGMALQALTAEESDTTKLERLIDREDSKIEKACWDHMIGDTGAVRNVDDVERGWVDWAEYPPPANWIWL